MISFSDSLLNLLIISKVLSISIKAFKNKRNKPFIIPIVLFSLQNTG